MADFRETAERLCAGCSGVLLCDAIEAALGAADRAAREDCAAIWIERVEIVGRIEEAAHLADDIRASIDRGQ